MQVPFIINGIGTRNWNLVVGVSQSGSIERKPTALQNVELSVHAHVHLVYIIHSVAHMILTQTQLLVTSS
jgi:hypothetical protein